ncbi:MAG: M48 family metallopeptidase [Clostridiales bacterium]|jgi:predicted metal-dependent hydrolase|nr:M48 family metallopeptidase [Clostridiales bacterium]
MNYTLIRSKRKTCAIYIRGNTVEVHAPLWITEQEIDDFVESKEHWITNKLAECAAREEKKSAFLLEYGDQVRYLGGTKFIVPREGDRIGLSEEGFYMPPGLSMNDIKRACIKIYLICAKSVIIEKVSVFAQLMNLSPASVKINSAAARWGSCSSAKNLNFSWRIMMASDKVIDYVVVHELAHLKKMNHSRNFWTIVEEILPDYQDRRKELQLLQEQLNIENWRIV